MNKSIATFLIAVVFTIPLLLLADWIDVSWPKWIILMICGGLGLLLANAVFHQWSRRASRRESR